MGSKPKIKMIKPDIYDVDGLIDARFGKEGTPRVQAEKRAYAFYTGAVIEEARKKVKIAKRNLHGASVQTVHI